MYVFYNPRNGTVKAFELPGYVKVCDQLALANFHRTPSGNVWMVPGTVNPED